MPSASIGWGEPTKVITDHMHTTWHMSLFMGKCETSALPAYLLVYGISFLNSPCSYCSMNIDIGF